MIQDVLHLVRAIFIDENSMIAAIGSFRIWLVAAFLLSVGTWVFCIFYARLWNRRFHHKPVHHLWGALAALISFVAVFAWYIVSNLEPITKIMISAWSIELKTDQDWGQATFAKAYQAVKEQGVESFYGVPQPDQSGSYIPINHDASRVKAAYVYANESYQNFDETHPLLAFILDAQVGLAEDSIRQDVNTYLAGGDGSSVETQPMQDLDLSSFSGLLESTLNTLADFSSTSAASASGSRSMYPVQRAVDLASAYLQISLAEKAYRTVLIGRVGVFIAFLLLQAIPFGIIGFATRTLSVPYFSETEDNSLPIGAALSLNLFSPNSILNFSLRALYAGGNQYIKLEDQAVVLSYNRLELPLLACLNFKKDVSSTTSFLVQGGPSFVHYFNSSTSLSEEVQPLSNQHISLTGGIGLEFQYEKTEDGSLVPRSAIELNYSHPLESNISPEFNTLSGSFINGIVETTRMGYINLSVHIYTR